MIDQSSNPPISTDLIVPKAVIDVGTNTLRLLIGYIENGKLIRIMTMRSVTRLGAELIRKGILRQERIEESIRSLIQFKVLIDKYKISNIVAVGTSALRDASNSDEFIQTVKEKIGIPINVISGEQEAELTVRGIFGFRNSPSVPAFIMDIGGGSTEWAIVGGSLNGMRNSVQIGAVKLNEQFLTVDPQPSDVTDKMRSHIIEAVKQSFLNSGITLKSVIAGISSFVATGGTAATVAMIDLGLDRYHGEAIHLHELSFARLSNIYKELSSVSLQERAKVKGIEPGRSDIIVPGILIMIVMMEMINAETLIISDYGLLEGLLML